MAVWVVGDLHGMIGPLRELERKLGWRAGRDRVILLGDLVGRGRSGLEVLRWACARREWVCTLLGNHDFALLLSAAGLRRPDADFRRILAAPEAPELLAWLRRGRLLIEEDGWLLVHAGILPAWSRSRALEHARAVEAALATEDRHRQRTLLKACWGNRQVADDPELPPARQLQLAVNAFCRLRWCNPDGSICLDYEHADPAALVPWYRQRTGEPAICGHWSQHGLCLSEDFIMLDCGCVYGRPLAAWNLSCRIAVFAASASPARN